MARKIETFKYARLVNPVAGLLFQNRGAATPEPRGGLLHAASRSVRLRLLKQLSNHRDTHCDRISTSMSHDGRWRSDLSTCVNTGTKQEKRDCRSAQERCFTL